MIRGIGSREQVEGDAEIAPVAQEFGVVPVDDLLGRHSLVVGPHRDRRTVGIRARHHENVVAGRPLIAGEDVSR